MRSRQVSLSQWTAKSLHSANMDRFGSEWVVGGGRDGIAATALEAQGYDTKVHYDEI